MSQSNLVSFVAPPVPPAPFINPPDLRAHHQSFVRPSEGAKQSEDDHLFSVVYDEASHVPPELPPGLAASHRDDSRWLLSEQDSDQCSSRPVPPGRGLHPEGGGAQEGGGLPGRLRLRRNLTTDEFAERDLPAC